jgi:hypothetical protein
MGPRPSDGFTPANVENHGMSPARTTYKAHHISDQHLLRHCQLLDDLEPTRQPARDRLEAALGPALTARLVTSLSPTGRIVRD